jgi:hypothetical protein
MDLSPSHLFPSVNQGLVRRVQKTRNARPAFFGDDLFADPPGTFSWNSTPPSWASSGSQSQTFASLLGYLRQQRSGGYRDLFTMDLSSERLIRWMAVEHGSH